MDKSDYVKFAFTMSVHNEHYLTKYNTLIPVL